jgi:hypothetical protein
MLASLSLLLVCGVARAQTLQPAAASDFIQQAGRSQDLLSQYVAPQPSQTTDDLTSGVCLAFASPTELQPPGLGSALAQVQPGDFVAQTPAPTAPPPPYPPPYPPPVVYVPYPPPPPSRRPAPWRGFFTISGGYSNVTFNGNSAIPYSHDGGYIDFAGYTPIPNSDALIAGLGLTWSGYWNDYSVTYRVPPFYTTYSGDISMFEIEGRIGYQIGARSGRGIYILPRIGAGLLIDNYTVGRPYYGYSYFYGSYISYTGLAFEIRPDIELGYRINNFNIGCEASYMAAWGDFGKLGSMAQEARVGVVLGFRY